MGAFDEVTFNCPHCQAQIVVQSKAGPCMSRMYHADDVPMGIAADLNGKLLHCDRCTGRWFIRVRAANTVPCDLIHPPPTEEDNSSWLKTE